MRKGKVKKSTSNARLPAIAFSAVAVLALFAILSFALPQVTYVSPTLSDNATTGANWVFVNLTSSENLNQSLLEWGNTSGFTNVSMSNVSASITNWYVNMTSLTDGRYNYTVWAENTTGGWNRTARRFVVVQQGPSGCSAIGAATYNAGTNTISLYNQTSTLCTLYYDVNNESALSYITSTNTYDLKANITLGNNATFIINDTTLILNTTNSIRVIDAPSDTVCNRTLKIKNAEIYALDYNKSEFTDICGIVEIENATIHKIGIDKPTISGWGAFYLRSSDVNNNLPYFSIKNSTVYDVPKFFGGYYLETAIFENNNFSNITRSTIDLYNQINSSVIRNNLFNNVLRANALCSNGDAVICGSDNSIIENNTISYYGYAGGSSTLAICIKEKVNISLDNNRVTNPYGSDVRGLANSMTFAVQASINLFRNNFVNATGGMNAFSTSGAGVFAYNYYHLINNTFIGGLVESFQGHDLLIRDNNIRDCGLWTSGILISPSGGGHSNVTLWNNTISNCATGGGQIAINIQDANVTVIDFDYDGKSTYSISVENTKIVNANYTNQLYIGSGKVAYVYYYSDVNLTDFGGNSLSGMEVRVTNDVNSSHPSKNLLLPLQDNAVAYTESNGHTSKPSENASNTIVLMDYWKTSSTQQNMTYTITAYDPNNIWTNVTHTIYPNGTIQQLQPLANVSGVNPDASWYRSNPNTYQNTTTLQINYTKTNITIAVTNTTNITVSEYSQAKINFTATNTTASQKMNITISNSTFPVVNGWQYHIKKDGVIQSTQAASSNQVIFTNISIGSEYIIESFNNLTVTLNTPQNNNVTNNASVTFNCSASTSNNLTNITLYTNQSSWSAKNSTNITGTTNSSQWVNTLADGTYIWNCRAYDDTGNSSFAISNYTLTIDTIAPFVQIILPANTTYNSATRTLNYTATDLNLNAAWYGYNGTNTTLSGNATFTALANQQSTLVLYANDSAGNVNSTSVTFTVDTSAPVVSLASPANAYNTSTASINFTFNVTDNINASMA
ncbi:MAG: hypothetical protein ABIG84_00630, partial [archaeon]